MKEKNPLFWLGISFILTGIFFSFILPVILHHFPHTKKWVKTGLIWYHIFGIIFGIYITWYIYKSDI